jgi:hypothetical protein
MFAIDKSSMNTILHEFIVPVNVVFKIQIQWPRSEDLLRVMASFKDWCDLPSVQGVIDCTQIHMQKPKRASIAKCFSYKSKAYNMQLQAMVDHEKQFQDVFVRLIGSMNDTKVLQMSSLYKNATFDGFLDPKRGS